MRNKKGAIELQFSWIFIFVIGAMILLFIVGFVNTQRQQSEQSLGEKIAKDLNTVITQTSVSVGKADIVDIPNRAIEFNCEPDTCTLQGCTSGFKVSNTNVGWDTPIQAIFSPDIITGRSLLSWSLDWSMPYHATNFLYLTSPDVRYIFVKSPEPSDKINEIFTALPAMMNKELIESGDLNQISNKNNYKVKMIYYNTTPLHVPQPLRNMPANEITAIKITPETAKEIGNITFYKNQNGNFVQDGLPTHYLGLPSLYGAIFSEDKELYECNMKKAFIKLHMATQVYYEVIKRFNESQPNVCKNYYNCDSSSPIFVIGDVTRNLDLQQTEAIYLNATKIRDENHVLKIYSCPLIY